MGTFLGYGTARSGKTAGGKRSSELDYGGFHGRVSCGSHRCTFLFHLEGTLRRDVPVVGFGQPGNWDELSPAADAPGLQDSEVGGIFSHRMRHAGSGRRANFLGGDTPHSSSVFRFGRRSAFADRRQVVV